MAEIDLERKRRGGWWPWIIGLLVLLLLIWVLADAFDREEEVVTDDVERLDTPPVVAPPPGAYGTPDEARAALPGAVQEYRQTCTGEAVAPEEMGRQHEFTVRCMQLMAGSFDAAVQADTVGRVAIDQRVEAFRSNAQRLEQSDPAATTHAGIVAETMRSAAELLRTLRQQRYAQHQQLERSAQRVREAAESVTEDRPLLEQRDTVQRFFEEMGNALQAIATDGQRTTTGAARS